LNENTYTLRDYIVTEMKKRNMSARQFAQLVGVSNTTINRLIDKDEPDEPTLDFLVKLARATHIPLVPLVELSYPDLVDPNQELNPQARILAQQIEQLPPQAQDAITMMIRGLLNTEG
jgi:transcriptional regulator with XRE-family HTH domain